MLFMCLIAALGELRALARTAMVFRPIILLVLIFVAICALPDVDFNELLPPFEDGVAPAFKGVLPLMNIAAISFYFIFLEDHTDGRFSVKGFLPWALTYVVITLFLCIYVLGTLGLELTRNLAHPFFAVIRELSIFSALERIESVIVGLWVFPDFILISVMLKIAAKLLCRGFGLQEPGAEGLPLLSLRSSRWLVWLCAIMAGIAALIVGGNSYALLWCSLKLIPWLHMIFAAIIIPLCCIIWCIRNRRTAK